MKAREIFKSANSFIVHHLSFTLYYFLLMMVSELLSFITFTHLNIKTEEMPTSDFQLVVKNKGLAYWNTLLPATIQDSFSSPYVPYLIFVGIFITLVLFMALTFFIQAQLRKRSSSLAQEMAHCFHALSRAPWVLMWFFITTLYTVSSSYITQFAINSPMTGFAFFGASIFYLCAIAIPFYYMQPLLYDNFFSIVSVFNTSISYLKKSWFLLLKYFLLCGLVYLLLNGLVIGVWFILKSPILTAGSLVAKMYIGLLGLLGSNIVYNHLRTQQ